METLKEQIEYVKQYKGFGFDKLIENILTDLKTISYTGKIFMKNNIKKIYPDIELIQEYPFERGAK